MIILWFFVLPLILFVVVFRNRTTLYEKDVKARYSFLYRGYKAKKYYWEFIVMIRKYALMAIVIFGSFHSPNLQFYACLYVIIIAYYIQEKVRPYA